MRVLLAAVALVVTLGGCVSPAWDDHDYELKAQETTKTAHSLVEMARLAVQHSDDLHKPYLKTVLTDAAVDLGNVAQQFGGVQPPSDASDQVRDRTLEKVQQAEDELDSLLIQIRRGGIEQPRQAAARLEKLAGELQ
ncbi:hypothetical protein HTZ77_22660 [Nonomuraea sp. SMC257]|uniref:Uncharacterized protein n=1 Tax=Nonomuraea montanisoli TaxID=2741721 RepID=A0A7Y6I9J2_9ACTN|nr:hypothetical protein [Nonomuraea montanisoli]NUW34215.1 hypothetical protein [Nonomuraea montanisoli]